MLGGFYFLYEWGRKYMKQRSLAIYLRISVEDKGKGNDDSKSISNQRNLLLNYAKNSPDLSEYPIQEFCDDGLSGKIFNRPYFQKMIEAVKQGEIYCILVKDISRFGRDYITVGGYLSYFFPFFNVRFISVIDNFDSSRPGDIDSLDVAFKTLTYDFYSRDLSAKVRQAKLALAKEGNFLPAFAPYGYTKNPANTRKLIPDPDTAPIVQHIFSLASQGFSTKQIAKELNDNNILTPYSNRIKRGEKINSWKPLRDNNFWVGVTVKRILCNEHYLGWTIYGKRTCEKVGSSYAVPVPKDKWITVKDTHEPLVSLELFQCAHQIFRVGRQSSKPSSPASLFPRMVHCADCGFTMKRCGTAHRPYYYCDTSDYTTQFSCSHVLHIYEDELSQIVLDSLKPLIQCAVSMDKIFFTKSKNIQLEIDSCLSQLKAEKNVCLMLGEKSKLLYESFICGTITKESFLLEKKTLSESRLASEKRLAQLQEQFSSLSLNLNQPPFVEHFKKYQNLNTLSNEISQELIYSIFISSDGSIEITWNFMDATSASL